MDEKFKADMLERMRGYFGTANKPVTLMRAETDLLVRTLTTRYALLVASVNAAEQRQDKLSKKGGSDFHDTVVISQAETDLALITSICGKLRESEKENRG